MCCSTSQLPSFFLGRSNRMSETAVHKGRNVVVLNLGSWKKSKAKTLVDLVPGTLCPPNGGKPFTWQKPKKPRLHSQSMHTQSLTSFESLQWELNCKMSFREDKTSSSAGILLEMAGCGAHSGTTHVRKVPGSFTC